MTSLISLLKQHACNIPRGVGEVLARIPYSTRPCFAESYRRARENRRWFDEKALPDEQRKYIFENVVRIVRHAVKNVPFYSHYYSECGFTPESLHSFDDLSTIPIVTKELLQNVDIESRSCKRRGRTLTYTGGSTGEPFKFYSDALQIGNEWAHMHHIWSKLGYRQSNLLLTVALDDKRPPVYYDALRHSLVLNVHHPRETIIDAFRLLPESRRRVQYFRGYPSSISEFLAFCEEKSPEILEELRQSLKGAFLASEFPLPVFRNTIERTLNCPTVSWYGHSERAILAWEKTRPWVYETMQSYGFCEAVKQSDGFVSLVGTSYWNFASPLIRYQVNDGVRPIETKDGILRAFEIEEGRLGDFITDKSGERFSITHLNLSCKESTWALARCIQVEQRAPGSAIFWVTPRHNTTIEELRKAFDFERLNLDCEFRLIDRPFVTARGKVLLKVSTVEKK